VVPAEVRSPNDLDTVFQGSAKSGVQGGLSCSVDGMSFNERDQVATLAAAASMPTIYGFRDHVDEWP
jgi:hypothetical protein